MKNLNQLRVQQDLPTDNLSEEAKKLLEILNELEDFTINLKRKLMTELKVDIDNSNKS